MQNERVLVTWLDGNQEEYCGETRVTDGVLHVYAYTGTVLTGEYHIPLVNIRVWTKPK